MSTTLEEKLAVPVVSFAKGDARQDLEDLRKRWGLRAFTGIPDVIEVDVPHDSGVELWRVVGAKRGGATVYEIDRSAA